MTMDYGGKKQFTARFTFLDDIKSAKDQSQLEGLLEQARAGRIKIIKISYDDYSPSMVVLYTNK